MELDNKAEACAMLSKALALPDRERDEPQVRARARAALAQL